MKVVSEKTAPMLILIAATCWGIIGIFTRPLFAAGLSAMQVAFIRLSVTALALLLYLAVADRAKLRLALRDLPVFLIMGLGSLLLFNFFYFYTLEHSTLSVAAVLLYTAPCFVILLSAVFLRERVTSRKLISLVLAFFGCTLACGLFSQGQAVAPLALAAGLASGFCYGLYSLLGRYLLKKYHPLTVTTYIFAFAALGSLFICRPAELLGLLAARPAVIAPMLVMSLGCTLAPFLLYTTGLAQMEAGKASVLAIFEPLVATVTGALVFREALTAASISGVLLIFAAIVLLNTKGLPHFHRAPVPKHQTPGCD